MKKIVLLSSIMLLGVIAFAQNNLHDGKVVGIIDLGPNEVVVVNDENTGCNHKSETHTKGLFRQNENVKIDFNGNGNNAEIIKPNLPEQVYLNRKCIGQPNTNNPYEWAGIQHNALMDLIGSSVDVNNFTNQELYNVVNSEHPLLMDFHQMETEMNNLFQNIDGFADAGYNQGRFTLKERNELNKIMNILKSNIGVNELVNQLIHYESSVVLRSDLSEKERTTILGSSAVARYSATFWNEALHDQNNVWHAMAVANSTSGNGTEPLGKVNWGKLGADLAGFAIGFTAGVLVGNPVVAGTAGVGLAGVMSTAA